MMGKCIRLGAARLCLAMLLALLLVPGYVVAPVLFAKSATAAEAGMLAGHVFHLSNIGILLFAASLAFFWIRMRRPASRSNRWRWLLLLGLVLLVAANEFALAPLMADLKLQMGPIDDVAMDDPLRHRFGMFHGISALLHLLATGMAGFLVALGVSSCASTGESDELADSMIKGSV